MQTTAEIEERIWNYLDNGCEAAERVQVERLIANNEQWKLAYDKLILIHKALGIAIVDEPSMRFSKNVMDELNSIEMAPMVARYINDRAIRFILYTCALVIVTLFIGIIIYTDWGSSTSGNLSYIKNIYQPGVSYSLAFAGIIALLVLLDTALRSKSRAKHSAL